jgi:hypothetical protein
MNLYAQKCDCGAITVSNAVEEEHEFSNSMTQETFNELFKDNTEFDIEWLQETYNCNHCVNHWGLDLCKCGSGDPVGECEWEDCEEHGETMETFLQSAPSILEIFAERGGF